MSKRVYFLRPVGQLGPIKIGCSKEPQGRLVSFASWSPTPLELILSVPGDHADERALHAMFSAHHSHGEWFAASKELLALIEHCAAFGELPPFPVVLSFPKRHAVQCGRPTGAKPQRMLHDLDRELEIGRRYKGGETLEAIGKSYGISRERVRQILRKSGVPSQGLRKEHVHKAAPLTEGQLRAIELHREGASPRDIIAGSGITYSQMRYAFLRTGLDFKPPGHWTRRPDNDPIAATIIELYGKGLTTREIANRVGLSDQARIYRYLKRAGISPNRRAS